MKKDTSGDMYRRLSHALISALTGQARLSVTLLVYSTAALLLLTYVSAQVYTSVLTQEITRLKQEKHHDQESLNKLTSSYISLTSRSRVSNYCETVLGMERATDGCFERFAVKGGEGTSLEPVEFTERHRQIPDPYRFTLHRESEQASR